MVMPFVAGFSCASVFVVYMLDIYFYGVVSVKT